MADYKKDVDRFLDDMKLRERDAEAVEQLRRLFEARGQTEGEFRRDFRKVGNVLGKLELEWNITEDEYIRQLLEDPQFPADLSKVLRKSKNLH